ncbi:Cytochrome P450 CYP2 subfamily [Handroanthus impetiginosus]|uniref:Cytochrome P450 CYP2 subfamily n=1 Tax=Handroanthus impetiginosus TaxID=429701 RepID=A0A2G9FYA3_9LAMI|nr:Cytochrome P450 CYP2 subfamily [Handroanthus impetiginosus]
MDEIHLYILLFTLTILFYAWYFTRGKKTLPPSPPKLPIIGNLHQIGELPHRSLWQLSKKHGPLMFLRFGSRPTLIVSSAEVAKEIMKTHDLSFASKPVLIVPKKLFYDMTDLINLPYGKKWRKLRSIFMHQLLSSTRVKSFNSIREEEKCLFVEKIKGCFMSSSPVNLTDMFKLLTNDMICSAAFGKKHSESKYGKMFLDSLDEAVGLLFNFTLVEFVPWLGWINWLTGYNAALDKCVKKRDEVLDAITEEYLAKSGDDKSKQCFVDILLDIYKGNIPGVSIDLITLKSVILDVFGAGTETSATTLAWVMTELIRHPEVMKKLQDEIREIMKEKHHITDDDLEKMHYLKAVVKETFRVHPPVAIYFHLSREYVNLMGFDIEPETMVIINAWAIGRDPAYWPEPEKFMPERFLNSSVNFRGSDFQLIPFGAGRRICPGLGFAVSSIEHMIANLMHKFDWALPDGAKGEDLDVMEKPGFTIGRKNPLLVVPTKCYF